MHIALHPQNNFIQLTVPEYKKEFGNGQADPRFRPRCPVCDQQLSIVGSSSPNTVGHFSHMPKSGYCPTKIKAGIPYFDLFPKHPDLEAANRIKILFLEHWEAHFSRLNELVHGLSVQEFVTIVRLANDQRIWEYSKLREYQLPYVFATLKDFPPHESIPKGDGSFVRKFWFRCWFDVSVTRYDDIWIHRTTPLKFWRAWYEQPKVGCKPKTQDLIRSYSLELNGDLSSAHKISNAYILNRTPELLMQIVTVV